MRPPENEAYWCDVKRGAFPLHMVILLLRALAGVLRADDAPEDSLDHWKAVVRARFPGVSQLSTTNLAAWLADTNRARPLLLDVRTEAEFRVSHLPGARRVDPDAKAAELRALLATTNTPVVVYCSVGWRSSALAERLLKAGQTNVSNLEGSIFGWSNEGRPLEADTGPATRVHPYNRTFGRLLQPALRADP